MQQLILKTVEVGDKKIKVDARQETDWREVRRNKKGRVHVGGSLYEPAVPMPKVEDFPELGLTSIFTHRGDYPEVDRAFDQHNRAIVKAQREVLDAVASQIGLELGTYKFSRTAGCSCGCSPGWVVDGPAARQKIIWLSLEKEA